MVVLFWGNEVEANLYLGDPIKSCGGIPFVLTRKGLAGVAI